VALVVQFLGSAEQLVTMAGLINNPPPFPAPTVDLKADLPLLGIQAVLDVE
jgi:hypothetical protein